ncbi:helix-turn-helix transcriptional regulator [Salmonella enterica]|nr:XRE family transcriptional regulator [Salmonella enterica]EAQ5917877.1 XRE family transcriptional regulator [Salmonella enterica subsp. enterica serovar Inverness]EAQ5751433.1 XRE family transcriptional regulator [Salmonella enterica]EAW7790208.1 helix-turn-helix transcriptional regulator [Salmonella enterica]EAW7850147.1 helix-turn-helix transcriptional regulator [Salmonella enterica]
MAPVQTWQPSSRVLILDRSRRLRASLSTTSAIVFLVFIFHHQKYFTVLNSRDRIIIDSIHMLSQYYKELFMTKENHFIKRMIARRVDQGLSQEELSKKSGVAAAQISRYELGKSKPRPNVIARLAEALNVPFEWLAYGDNDVEPVPIPGIPTRQIELPEDLANIIKKKADEMGIPEYEFIERMLAESFVHDGILEKVEDYYTDKKPT